MIISVEVDCPVIHSLNCSRCENEKGGLYKNLNSKVCVYIDKVPARVTKDFVVWSHRLFHMGFFQLYS